MSTDRTEKPTARRLREARKKGQLARSRDLGQALAFGAAVLALVWAGAATMSTLLAVLQRSLARMGENPLTALDSGEVTGLGVELVRALVWMVAPVAGATVVVVVAANTAQGGWVFAPEALHVDWKRLNPATGLRRLGLSHGGIELAKGVLAAIVLTMFSVDIVRAVVNDAGRMARVGPTGATVLGWEQALRLMRQAALVLLALAAADYAVQRWRFSRSQRMTKQEVRDDHRLTEGSPETRARVRRVQRDMVRRRMLAAVPRATVVVTNPTQYAVALEYQKGALPAPRVVAKGRGLVAARIREIARENGVPIVENVPLARALYQTVDLGEFIPGALFEAVAEVLAYLIRLKQLTL